jgi:hypothetical protein
MDWANTQFEVFRDILADFKPGEEPLHPAAAGILRQMRKPGEPAVPA